MRKLWKVSITFHNFCGMSQTTAKTGNKRIKTSKNCDKITIATGVETKIEKALHILSADNAVKVMLSKFRILYDKSSKNPQHEDILYVDCGITN